MNETSTEPLPIVIEDNDKEVLHEQEGEVTTDLEKKFITSPADIEVHRKVELQDAEITEAQLLKPLKIYVWNLVIYFPQIQVILEKHLY